MKSLSVKIILHVLLPLVAGLYIYYQFRPDVAIIRCYTNRLPAIPYQQLPLGLKWLVMSGPDFCWAYSLSSALYLWALWQGNRWRFFPFIVTGILLLSEVLQVFLLPGFTFDLVDLAAVFAAVVLSTLFLWKKV